MQSVTKKRTLPPPKGDPTPTRMQKRQAPTTTTTSPPVISYHRQMHFLFMATYAVFSCIFIIGCAIWINYRSIFQSGMMGYFHILTGILVGVYITSNTVEDWALGEVPASKTARDELRKRREYAVFRRSASTFIVVAIIGIMLSAIYLYNLGYIMIGICPTIASDDAAINPTLVNIHIAYQHKPIGDYYAKKSVFILRYNMTSQTIVRKTRDRNPNEVNYDRWFVQNELHTIGKTNEAPPPSQPFCVNRDDSMLFSFIENEISHYVFKNSRARQDAKTIRITDKYQMDTSDDEEDEIDLNLLTTRICRHEYAFVIILMTFILLWDLLSIALIIYCIYLLRA